MKYWKIFTHRLSSQTSYLQLNSGFTLIEILVIFSVIAVLSGVGAVALSTYSQSQQLTQASNSVKLVIREARFNAISSVNTAIDSNGNETSCGTRTLEGYLAKVNTNLNSIQLFMVCSGDFTLQILLKKYVLPNPITLTSETTCSDIHFNALTATADGVPCEIHARGFGQEKIINVDEGGNIFVN